jgi:hypothetical protein
MRLLVVCAQTAPSSIFLSGGAFFSPMDGRSYISLSLTQEIRTPINHIGRRPHTEIY